MYAYSHDPETGGLLLADELSQFSKEPRPVWSKELALLGFDKIWKFDPECPTPYLWAEANFYWYRGKRVAKTVGGSLYEKPSIELERDEAGNALLPEGSVLEPVDMARMLEKNRIRIEALETFTIRKIYDVYRKYEKKLDCFHVAFSGGKDSVALLELVGRALPHTAFMVIFGDTGMEFPDTYNAVDEVEKRCKAEDIAFYRAESRFKPEESWRLFGPPSRVLRWCCTVHKSVPQTLKIREVLGKRDYTGMAFVGVRGHESESRAEYDYENFGKKQKGQYSFNPMLEWTSAEVWLYLFSRSLVVNAAYRKGMARVGCLFCPLGAGGKSDWFQHEAYKENVEVYMRLIRETSVFPDENGYINGAGWVARKNGRDIRDNNSKISETIKDGRIVLAVSNPTTNWREWLKTLGELIDLKVEEAESPTEEDQSEPSFVPAEDALNHVPHALPHFSVSYPVELAKTTLGKKLKQCFVKAAYCVECGECEANCRAGALSFRNGLHIENCIHCGQCHTVEKGCQVFHCLNKPLNEGVQMKSINTFATHAPMPEWISTFFSQGSDFIKNNTLGPMQIAFFKRFLSDSGLIAKNVTTPFFDLAKNLESNSVDAWSLILTNLANGNPQIAWYVRNMEVEHAYSRQELYDMIAATGLKKDGVMAIIRAFGRLCDIPLGTRLHFGNTETKGRDILSLTRTKPVSPSPLVFLYGLYRFAEECGQYYEFTLSRLLDFDVESGGVSPAQIFALSREECEPILNGLSHSNGDFLSFTTTHDLELVRLSEDKTAEDVLKLFGEG